MTPNENDGLTQAIIRAAKIGHLNIVSLNYSPDYASLETVDVTFLVTKELLADLACEIIKSTKEG